MDRANLANAYLEATDLRGANLSSATLDRAILNRALWDSDTQFPEEFNSYKTDEGFSRGMYYIGSGQNLSYADLSGADLSGVNLSETNLNGA